MKKQWFKNENGEEICVKGNIRNLSDEISFNLTCSQMCIHGWIPEKPLEIKVKCNCYE